MTAQSFVDAWNYTAYSPNAQGGSYFFANVEGYGDLQAPTDDDGQAHRRPGRQEMSGLERRRREDHRGHARSAPFAQYPVTVGYNAFFPLPESFFEDPEAAGKQPRSATARSRPTSAFEDGPGHHPDPLRGVRAATSTAKADTVEFKVYSDVNTAYTDVQGGNLDVVKDIPPDAITTAPGRVR